MKGRNSHFLLVHPRTDLQCGSDIRCFELCTGAFSGWSHAIGKLRENGCHIEHAWGLDMDPFCCRFVAKTHGFCHISDDRHLMNSQHEMHPCVYQADISRRMVFITCIRQTVPTWTYVTSMPAMDKCSSRGQGSKP